MSCTSEIVLQDNDQGVHQRLTLDVGCNQYKLPGALGIDRFASPGVDVVHDLDQYPWPFDNDSFDRVICRHVLAHLQDVVRAMEEMHRIARPGALLEIITPHFSSDNAFTDITSRHFFGYRSMDYFCGNRSLKYRYTGLEFRLRQSHISFRQAHCFDDQEKLFNPLAMLGVEWLVNSFPRLYEHFFTFLIRANELYFQLEVVK